MKKRKTCTCDICKRYRKWDKFLKKYPFTRKDREFLDEIFLDLNMTEFNYGVDEAILDGSWPSAIEQLQRALVKAVDIKKRRNKGERI
jgi:hypothetical protein